MIGDGDPEARRQFLEMVSTAYYKLPPTQTHYCVECRRKTDHARKEHGDWETLTCVECNSSRTARTR